MADQYVYSPIDFCADCFSAGFRVGKGLATVIAIAGAETAGTFDPKITNTAGNTPPSTDRGILQINSYWHPEVSDACAFDPVCSAIQGFRISSQGTSFSPWATYTNGAYKRYMSTAWMAIDAFQRVVQINGNVDSLNAQINNLKQQLTTVQQQAVDEATKIADLQSQITQLNSADQQTIASLQKQITEVSALRDAALTRAVNAEGELTKIQSNLNTYLSSVKQQILGS